MVYSLDKALTRLRKALVETKLIDWNKEVLFPCNRIEYKDPLNATKAQISKPFQFDGPSYIWWLPKEKAMEYTWR